MEETSWPRGLLMLINGWGFLACIVSCMAVGGLWYGPLFGRKWTQATGRTPEAIKEKGAGYGIFFMLVVAVGMAMFTIATGAVMELVHAMTQGNSNPIELLETGPRLLAISALCLPVAALFCAFLGMMHGFAGRPFALWLIDAGYVMTAMIVLVIVAGLLGGPDPALFTQ